MRELPKLTMRLTKLNVLFAYDYSKIPFYATDLFIFKSI